MSDPKGITDKQQVRIPVHNGSSVPSLKQASSPDEPLPLGVLATGGRALRKEGWTGKGIRVAVIDSGIDETHPNFDGKVTRKKWYRYGTPLSDIGDGAYHGTHVAGTIHFMAPEAEIYDYRVFGKDGILGINASVAAAIKDAAGKYCTINVQ